MRRACIFGGGESGSPLSQDLDIPRPVDEIEGLGPKRRKALLERGRFWAEIQKNKVMEDLFKKYDVSNTVNSRPVTPSGGEFSPPCRCVSWVGSLQEPAACVFAGAGGRLCNLFPRVMPVAECRRLRMLTSLC